MYVPDDQLIGHFVRSRLQRTAIITQQHISLSFSFLIDRGLTTFHLERYMHTYTDTHTHRLVTIFAFHHQGQSIFNSEQKYEI